VDASGVPVALRRGRTPYACRSLSPLSPSYDCRAMSTRAAMSCSRQLSLGRPSVHLLHTGPSTSSATNASWSISSGTPSAIPLEAPHPSLAWAGVGRPSYPGTRSSTRPTLALREETPSIAPPLSCDQGVITRSGNTGGETFVLVILVVPTGFLPTPGLAGTLAP
jgi:hypothetical protein